MDNEYFEQLRCAFKSKNCEKISLTLSPLIAIISESTFLNDKLWYHPLGFIYAKIHVYESGEMIRLHIWNSNSKVQYPIMDIHNHFYNVNSFVYKGVLSNKIYKIDNEKEPTHRIYVADYLDNKRILRTTKESKHLLVVEEKIINSGEFYCLEKTQIHSGESKADVTITFVFSEDVGNPNPLVFGLVDGLDAYEYLTELVEDSLTDGIRQQISAKE